MTQSTISKYLERARRVYRPANVNSGVSLGQKSQAPGLRAKDTNDAMQGFNTEQAEYLSAVSEALILMMSENYVNEWLGDNELSADYILNLAELLWAREVDMYEIFEYLATYDTLDDVLAYDMNSGEDEFNLFF